MTNWNDLHKIEKKKKYFLVFMLAYISPLPSKKNLSIITREQITIGCFRQNILRDIFEYYILRQEYKTNVTKYSQHLKKNYSYLRNVFVLCLKKFGFYDGCRTLWYKISLLPFLKYIAHIYSFLLFLFCDRYKYF